MRKALMTATVVLAIAGAQVSAVELAAGMWFYGDWGMSTVYKDLMRQARPWCPLNPRYAEQISAPGDRMSGCHIGPEAYKGPATDVIQLDSAGWPLKVDSTAQYKPSTLVMADWHLQTVEGRGLPLGKYTLVCKGTGTVCVYIGGSAIDMPGRAGNGFTFVRAQGGETRHTFVIDSTYRNLSKKLWFIITIDYSSAADPIKDIAFLLPDDNGGDSYANNYKVQPYYPPMVRKLQPFKILRLMDWCAVMRPVDHVRLWSNRPNPNYTRAGHFTSKYNNGSDPSQDLGELPWEWMIDFCSALRKDMWICVHHGTDEAYWTELANLVKTRMKPGLKCYIEYSNEAWGANWTAYNDLKTYEGGGPYAAAAMSARLFRVFDNVFAGQTDRIVKVGAAWEQNNWFAQEYIGWYNNPAKNVHNVRFDILSPASYFAGDGQGLGEMPGAVVANVGGQFGSQAPMATQYGAKLVAYEGGFHCISNCIVLSRTAGIYDVYRQYITESLKYSPVVMNYAFVGHGDPLGHWGLLEYLEQPISDARSVLAAHKYRAFYDFGREQGLFDPQAVPPPLDLENVAVAPSITVSGRQATGRAAIAVSRNSISLDSRCAGRESYTLTLMDQRGRVISRVPGSRSLAAPAAPGYYVVLASGNGAATVSRAVLVP